MLIEIYFCVIVFSEVFFFQQKTAYEMRISDWSSDVCSSDLFDEQPFSWQACSSDLEIFCVLESHNARNADVEPKSQNFIGEIPAGCEAMDDAFIRSLPHFLRQYLRRISLGVADRKRTRLNSSH